MPATREWQAARCQGESSAPAGALTGVKMDCIVGRGQGNPGDQDAGIDDFVTAKNKEND
jgi:hypothetical protein